MNVTYESGCSDWNQIVNLNYREYSLHSLVLSGVSSHRGLVDFQLLVDPFRGHQTLTPSAGSGSVRASSFSSGILLLSSCHFYPYSILHVNSLFPSLPFRVLLFRYSHSVHAQIAAHFSSPNFAYSANSHHSDLLRIPFHQNS